MKTKTKNFFERVAEKVQINVYSSMMFLLITALIGVMMSMYSGSSDGRQAKQDNVKQQRDIDSIKVCRQNDRALIEQVIIRQELRDEEHFKMLERIDKRVDLLYQNELSK